MLNSTVWVSCDGAVFLKMPMCYVRYLVFDLVLVLISYLLYLRFPVVAECMRNGTFAMSEVRFMLRCLSGDGEVLDGG